MNIVEFAVKITDLASGPLARLGNAGNSTFARLNQSANSFITRINTVGASVDGLEKRLEQLTKRRNLSIDGREIRALNREIDELQRRRDRLTGSLSNGGLGNMLRNTAAIAGIGSMALLGKDIMQAGIQRQMDLTSLQVLLGTEAGNTVNNQLVEFAKKTIYGNEVFGEGKLLAGSGVKANNIMPIMSMIGDIAMGDKERMKSIALAFSEASSTGKLTGRQNLMFRTALFNPLTQLAEVQHKSVGQLEKDMEQGKVSINDLVKAMEHATGVGGRWHNMMQKLQDTPAGKWTAFTGSLSALAGTIGLKLLPVLGGLTDFMNGIISSPDTLESVAIGIGAMTGAWALYTAWVERASIQTAILEGLALWPLAVVGTVAYAFADLQKLNDNYANNTRDTFATMIDFITLLRRSWNELIYDIEVIILKTESWAVKLGESLSAFAQHNMIAAWRALTDDNEYDKKREKLRLLHEWDDAMDMGGGNNNKKNDPLFGFGKFKPTGDLSGDMGDTTKGITGGGVRSITINVSKFQDKTEIHTANIRESVEQLEEMLKDMFLRVTNSAAIAMN